MARSSTPSAGNQNAKPGKHSAKRQSKGRSNPSAASTWLFKPAGVAAEAAAYAAKQIKTSLGTVSTEVFDLNGDGIVDQTDVQLLTRKLQQAADKVLQSEPVNSALKAAAVGSVVAIPIPLIGPASGAATAVIFYFAYRGAKGIVRVASEPLKRRFSGTIGSAMKKTSSKRARAAESKA